MKRILAALFLFGLSFGFVEAAVVAYLRALYEPIHARLFSEHPADALFPLIRLEQLQAEGTEHVQRLGTELVREVATLVMLAAAALAVASNARQWFAGFMVVFGVWDIFFYIFLKVLLGWPESLVTWDLLFLLPVPWVGPVWSPALVSIVMIAAGVIVLWRESVGRPVRTDWTHAALIAAGGGMIIVAFCWDWRNIVTGGEPNSFNWLLFGTGILVGLSGFCHAAWASKSQWKDSITSVCIRLGER